MRRQTLNQNGQSLLELLVALLILVVALTATITLIVNSINAGKESRNRLIATSLAREGVEIVRNIRDSNWIDPAAPNWDAGLTNGTTATATPIIGIVGSPTTITFDNGANAQVKEYNNAYVQGVGALGVSVQFYRVMYINSICQDSSNPPQESIVPQSSNDSCSVRFGGTYSKVGIRVISEVHWPAPNSSKKIVVEDRLYNWQEL
jgi:Tfp pilus assembly protein PilV